MRIFKEFNRSSDCIICHTKKKGKAVLLGLDGTREDNIEEALQIHLDCLKLRIDKDKNNPKQGLIYQFLNFQEVNYERD
jgi:hypothetical protein